MCARQRSECPVVEGRHGMTESSFAVWRRTQAFRQAAVAVWIRDSFVAAPGMPRQVLPVCLCHHLSRAHRTLRDPALRAQAALHLRLWPSVPLSEPPACT
jgi:hypothetical protein